MNTIAIVRIILLASIFISMITTLLFMLPGLYMWFPMIISMVHIAVSIVGLFGVLSALSTESSEGNADVGWYCSIGHSVAVLLEIVLLFISVIYWGASTKGEVRRWYTNGAITIGIFMLIVDLVTFVSSVLFIAFVRRAKSLPDAVNHSGSVDL